jgi:hypothetical protein
MGGHKAEQAIPAIFATIHHRSEERPGGYTRRDIAWMNVVANQHIPELHKQLLEDFRRQFPGDPAKRE